LTYVCICGGCLAWLVGPSVVGRGWSPVPSNKARGCCCRATGDHRAPLQPRRAARRYFRVMYVGTRNSARADSRRSGVGLAPRPQALPLPAAALVLFIYIFATPPLFNVIRAPPICGLGSTCEHLAPCTVRRVIARASVHTIPRHDGGPAPRWAAAYSSPLQRSL
jgi:hypothetical protein